MVLIGCGGNKPRETGTEVLAFVTESAESGQIMITFSNLDGPYNFQRTDTKDENEIRRTGPIKESDFRDLLQSIQTIREIAEYKEPAGDTPMDLHRNYLITIMNSAKSEPTTYFIPKESSSDEMQAWANKALDLATKN